MRILLYTGKGGVGKTSVAAATACRLAADGKRVLIMSTDQAHSLGDSFEQELGPEPVSVLPGLEAMEIDAVKESEKAWGKIQGYIKEVLTSHARGGLETEELLVFPGLEELFSLFKILDIYEQDQYDVLIVDCAPTGETLTLLKFPEQFGCLLETVLPMKRKALKVAGPAIQKLTKIPMPKDSVFTELERLTDKLERMQKLMSRKDILSLRIVTTPERIVMKEAKHNFTCLLLFDYNVDAVVVNRIYPRRALEGYFDPWVQFQEESLKEIRESFCDAALFELELLSRELKGKELLGQVGRQLYGNRNPGEVFVQEQFLKVEKREESYLLKLKLPFARKEDIELGQKGNELFLSVKNERRRLVLPDTIKHKEVESARMIKGVLELTFSGNQT